MNWLKTIAGVIGLADFWSKYFGKKADQKTGADLQQGANDAKTLDTITAVSRPVSVDESDRLWNENKSKFGTGQ